MSESDVLDPVRVSGLAAAPGLVRFLFDPLGALRKAHADYGSFVFMSDPRLSLRQENKIILTAGARFNREVLTNPNVWLTSSVNPRAPRHTAAHRLRFGLVQISGKAHEYYRRLLSPPLQRVKVDTLGDRMGDVIEEDMAEWPQGAVIDFAARSKDLLQKIAIGLLFGNDVDNATPVAEGTRRNVAYKWSLMANICRVDAPGLPYRRMLREAEVLERDILKWAAVKRGVRDESDLMSILVNSPNPQACPITDAQIVGHVPTLLGAAFETCQNALIWTIVLLDQHPDVARDLLDELRGALGGAAPSWDRVANLPLLDAVVKESLRIIPPVPFQIRKAAHDTTLAGFPVKKNWRVMLSPFLTNRNPDLYPQPDHFLPGRWHTINPSPFEYSVFSSGPRMCPGYWFGLAVLKMAISNILTRYRPALVPNAKIDTQLRVALMPRGRVPIVMHRQDGAFVRAPLRGSVRRLFDLAA